MAALARQYAEDHPEPDLFAFLNHGYRELWDRHGGIVARSFRDPSCFRSDWPPRPPRRGATGRRCREPSGTGFEGGWHSPKSEKTERPLSLVHLGSADLRTLHITHFALGPVPRFAALR